MPLKIVKNNIIDMHADAIVNTANPHPVVGSGVDAKIYHAAGLEELLEARRKIGNIPPGQAAITPAYKLNAKYIIHAVSPRWRGGHNCEEMLLKSTYESIMELAVQHECRSVAMPLLATGNNRFPRGMSLDLAVEVATKYIDALDQLDKDEFTVYLVIYDDASFTVAQDRFAELDQYIDEHFADPELMLCDCLESNYPPEHVYREKIVRREHSLILGSIPPISYAKANAKVWDEFVQKEHMESFSDHLFKLINKKGFTDTEVYKRANIDRRLFSKLRKKNYTPHKKTIFALLLALKLNMDEAMDLMRYAGITFAPNNITDLAVQWFLSKKMYDVIELNIFLAKRGEEPLN